jgi:hypothetical protein
MVLVLVVEKQWVLLNTFQQTVVLVELVDNKLLVLEIKS